MKRILALTSLLLLACGEPDNGFAAVEKSLASILATVSTTSGEVQVKHAAQGVWEPANTATPLYPGDWLRTGRGAWARLDFLNGSAIELEEDAVLVVEELKRLENAGPQLPTSAPLVAVESGSIRSTLADRAGTSRPLLLRTGDGAQARLDRTAEGGPAELRVARVEGETEVSVAHGEVKLATAEREETVATGHAAAVGKKGVKKVVLLKAPVPRTPDADWRTQFEKGRPLSLSWDAVPGASAYRAQVSSDVTFRKLAFARDLAEQTVDLSLERPGVYWWRVAARDTNGRQSLFGPARRVFLEKELPTDSLLEPKSGSAWGFGTEAPRIAFSWTPRDGVKSYRLVLAKHADLTTAIVKSEVTAEPQAVIDSLEPGEYFWGVFVQGANLEPMFLAARKLTVKKVAATNLVAPKRIKKWGE